MEGAMTSRTNERRASRGFADFRAPARVAYGLVILAFGVLGGWAAYAPLDSAAIAPGQIEVESRRKVIQHLEGGIIKEILVKEAEWVQEGQVLFRLEPIQARASVDMLRKQLDAVLAREARLLAERDGSRTISFPDELRSRPQAAAALADEERQFLERRQSVDNQVRMLDARLDQLREQVTGRARQEAALASQVESLNSELTAVAPIVAKGYYAKNKFLALQRDKTRLEGEFGQARAEGAKLTKQQEEVQIQIEQLRQKFREDAARELADARNRLSDLREKLAVAADVLTRVEVRAPMAGVVQNLRVAGVSGVIKAGEAIGELVPGSNEVVVAAQVSTLDIDSVAPGQKAEIRFAGLSSRRTPTIWGRVESVTADALLNDASKQPYYRARVIVERATLPAAVVAKLIPGMPADVLITTGERSVLDYIVGPLLNAIAKGMREE
jgi:HlyD family type I secretion membrane fusion protein